MKRITILGATGSIGVSTLAVIARHPTKFQVYALTARQNVDRLYQQCLQFSPSFAVLTDVNAANDLRQRLAASACNTEVLAGAENLAPVASDEAVDYVMAAIVGAAGLLPTLAAAKAGKRILLANKEALVMAGDLFMAAVKQGQAELLPIDSEHNAIFQCLPADQQGGVKSITLTASGGPFRELALADLAKVTPAQAIAHPNWAMGQKISVDSATMMNKGLEVIEAYYLFGKQPNVVLHPQSIIHSLVNYIDGSTLAQLGNPDMRTPIAHALAWPQRINAGVASLDLLAIGQLDFQAMDNTRFPCLDLAYQALNAGGSAAITLNAANEIAVAAFLQQQIGFTDIYRVIAKSLAKQIPQTVTSIADVTACDQQSREVAAKLVKSL